MKEALKNDRARIQVGRISSFGLMEMSRQRLRTGVLEASTKPCPHCEGTGLMRTASSAGLSRAAHDRGRSGPRPWRQDPAPRRPRSGNLSAQQEARRACRDRRALRRLDRGRDRRELRRRADERRELRPAPTASAAPPRARPRSKRIWRRSRRFSTRTTRTRRGRGRRAKSGERRSRTTTVRAAAVAVAGVAADADAVAARAARLPGRRPEAEEACRRGRPSDAGRAPATADEDEAALRPAIASAAAAAESASDDALEPRTEAAVEPDSSPMVERADRRRAADR